MSIPALTIDNLDSIHKCECFPHQRHRWSTNEEIAAILIAVDKHEQWLSKEVQIRPKSGSMMLYSRKRVRYRRDGYCWKKRKDGKTTREDHMKLKVQGTECIYGCYVHSAVLPTFHRRCYWLLQNPDIVLVHYLNVPYNDDNKTISPALNYFTDNKKEWTKDELICELKPMFFSENEPDLNNELEKSTIETIEAIVGQLMIKQRAKVKALEDASDGGINAKALTVVNAINSSTREVMASKQTGVKATVGGAHNKCRQPATVGNKRDVSLQQNINTVDNNSSKQLTTQGTVQLVQLANSGHHTSAMRTANTGLPPVHTSQSAVGTGPTPLIFSLSNLSQFQSGSGLLILNSPTATTIQGHHPNHRPNGDNSQLASTPLTVVYGRPNGTANGVIDTTSISNVICSTNNCLNNNNHIITSNNNNNTNNNMSSRKLNGLDDSLTSTMTTALENRLNYLNHLNTHNILNSNSNNNNHNLNSMHIKKEFEINGNIISASIDVSDSHSDDIITASNTLNYLDDPMIVNSNPSTPEHMKSSVHMLTANDQTTSGVDLNCNQLNHSQPQQQQHQLSLNHNHNYSYNQYFNSIHTNNNNHTNNNTNNELNNNRNQSHNGNYTHGNNGLMNYGMDSGGGVGGEVNPMDFIDNDLPTPDETLFNLDTFDILGDIDDHLDELSSSASSHTLHYRSSGGLSHGKHHQTVKYESSSANINNNNSNNSAQDYREITANITDYSPEWCYPEGGIKVLVAGPYFTSNYKYTILFDGVSVTTHLVQNGLLRCYSPEHEPGFVTLQVACDGLVISNSVIFEYRDHPTVPMEKSEDYFSVDENIFKFSLLERFELLESRLSQCTTKRGITGLESTKHFTNFEDRLVVMCSEMASCSWLPINESSLTTQSLRAGLSNRDMSLLHLTTALNYYKLMQCLLKWRKENGSPILELEVDAFSCDDNECTPLMWSCAKGHYESALILYTWNPAAIELCNKIGDSPLQLARKKGHRRLVDEIERLTGQQHLTSGLRTTTTITQFSGTPDNVMNNNTNGFIDNVFLKPRKASLDITTVTQSKAFNKNISPSTVKRGSACLQHGFNPFPKLVKCFSADSSLTNQMTDQLNSDSTFLLSCVSDSDDDLDMSTSGSTNGLSSSHRDSIGSCDIIMDCNSSESSRVLTLAEHIIAAMPDRIKAASVASLPDEDFDDDYYDDNENSVEDINDFIDGDIARTNRSHSQISDNFCNFSFEINDNYTYRESHTPSNSSPASSSCLHSPSSFQLDSPSPTPTAADFCEFFQASGKITKELGDLTLTDREQRELYEAAKVIQKAYRSYKGRKRQEEQNKCGGDKDKERVAAILIQSYYRRYKHYIYYRQMTKAAQVIQNQYRNYCEHKRFKKSIPGHQLSYTQSAISGGDSSGQSASATVSSYICNYSDCDPVIPCKSSREGTPLSGLKRTYSQRRRNQAARKIQQFMRQSKNKLQRERALAAEEGNATQEAFTTRAQTQQSTN
ncbi:calmodulin-binding transcription activator 2-like [Oppia nitens]|uniref:calmodulin-binding transcription activator 2-like n=1 Tax=Oppia nitens TaxID=1686743 RepID=UPI0023D9919A|nr:calmodulin-binding transcription activator 2-like [Oppia nitens]